MKNKTKTKSQLLDDITQLRNELTYVNLSKEEQSVELIKSEERFTLAMRGASDGLWDWDLKTDSVYYSPRWKSMLGYKEHELDRCLQTWADMVHPDDKDFVLKSVQDYLSNKVDSFEVEMRMRHKEGNFLYIRSRAFKVTHGKDNDVVRLIGTHVDITHRKKEELFAIRNTNILEMIAKGVPAKEIYIEIALMYEERHPGMFCSMLTLEGTRLIHGGAPSLPKEYCDAINGIEIGPDIGSCGTATYTGKRVLVEDIKFDSKWANLKHHALPHGLRSCWSEPVINASGQVLGAFGMYYQHPGLPNEDETEDLKSAVRLASIIMDRDHNLKRIKELAYTDELTGLASRAQLYLSLGALLKSSKESFTLIYLDLDNFKNINDSLGHDAGDQLLQEIATRLSRFAKQHELVARIGGDEFCILIKNSQESKENIITLATHCLEDISQPVDLLGRRFIPTCSLGIARYPLDGQDISSLLKAADTALYSAKDQGKNGYAFYQVELTHQAEYRFKVEHFLREAIENEALTLVYQTQVDIKTGNILGVEALARWHHPELGTIPPSDFIPIAERIGMIKPLTAWVLKTACQQAITWKSSGIQILRMAVNISPSHFLETDFVTLIDHTIRSTGMPPASLKLEVTESAVQTNQANLSVFKRLKELGVLIAIDDFGTGYSSFASLKHLYVDVLKIDKYFVDDILTNDKARDLFCSMIKMGQKLGYEIISEGVETQEQFNLLQTLGCDTVQGYLFSKPASADEISPLLPHI
jgi:diguanylate cyclase (GGDEF)-like protein/PAS domain S-box-containing protein